MGAPRPAGSGARRAMGFVLPGLLFHIEAPFVQPSELDAFLIAVICRSLKCFTYASLLLPVE